MKKARFPRVGILFSGQGFQRPGMMRDLYDCQKKVRERFSRANTVLNYRLEDLCFTGSALTTEEIFKVQKSEELKLNNTRFSQPAILAADVLCFEVLESEVAGLEYELMAGHSVGEYAAFVCSKGIDFEDCLDLVSKRASYMAEAVNSKLVAVMSNSIIHEDRFRSQCAQHGIDLALINTDYHYIVGGPSGKIELLKKELKDHGLVSRDVNISVASHTYLMRAAADKLKPHLDEASFRTSEVPVVANTTAQPISEPEDFRREAYNQMTQTVRWRDVQKRIYDSGINLLIACGLGTTAKNREHVLKQYANQVALSNERPEVLVVEDVPSLLATKERLEEIGF
jgi:[acyl-carrier-protein] S-malonyltransferase